MAVPVITVVMAVRIRMSGTVSMHMFVFVEHDLEPPAERRGDAAKSGEAWDMIAALQARGHDSVIRKRSASCFCVSPV